MPGTDELPDPPGVVSRLPAGAGVRLPTLPAWRFAVAAAAIIAAYVLAAVIGFRFAFFAQQVTTVWAPSGIAIAALLIGGRQFWPAIWLAAFIVNGRTDAPMWTAALLATGNALEAVIAATVLERHAFDASLRRLSDVLAFGTIAVILAPVVSATVGVTTLCAATVQPWDRYAVLWSDWWLGDALGALVVAPALLTIIRTPWTLRDALMAAVVVLGTIGITQVALGRLPGLGANPLEYVVFPVVIAAALTGGTRPACLAVLGASTVSIWNTAGGAGPFARPDIHHTLILLQAFTGVLAASGLLLGAAIAERADTQRREEEALGVLRHREEMLRLAQRAGGVATFEWDFSRQSARCSPEFFRMFGLPEDTDVIASDDWGRFVHPDDRQRMSAHLARVLTEAGPATADYRIVLADGTVRWLSYTGRVQQTAEGPRLLGSVVEITARKEAEQALERAKDAAESASRLKDEFLATLSHELRTPLNAVLGYAQMLRTGAVLPERHAHAVDVIERNATLQHQLIEDLLDMSRLTTGKLRVDPVPMSLDAVLCDAVDVVRPAADARRIRLEANLAPGGGVMIGDAARLQQVFWNLLTNALKFTPVGGAVTVTLRRHDGHAEIDVSDTGIGIDAAFLPFVFEPFRQAQDGVARTESGLGLGLAISRQLAELHGGTITASSPGLGQGATFVVRLPLRRV